MQEKDLNYWKLNAEEDYLKTPISVLRYISALEEELKQREINQAKNVLRENGYFADNLWRIEDVKTRFKCDNETAQDILLRALTRGDVVTQINEVIREISEEENLTEV